MHDPSPRMTLRKALELDPFCPVPPVKVFGMHDNHPSSLITKKHRATYCHAHTPPFAAIFRELDDVLSYLHVRFLCQVEMSLALYYY